jgi:alpha-galactosidase
MTAGLTTQLWEEADGDQGDDARRLLEQYLDIRKFYYGDYYPLTPYSQDKGVWLAWQFNLPDDGEGMVQAFRREESVYESARLYLHELVPDAHYLLRDMDADTSCEMSGRELMEDGLAIEITEKPYAAIITYKQVE